MRVPFAHGIQRPGPAMPTEGVEPVSGTIAIYAVLLREYVITCATS